MKNTKTRIPKRTKRKRPMGAEDENEAYAEDDFEPEPGSPPILYLILLK